MSQIKRLLIRDDESVDRGGKIIAIQGLHSEEIVNSMLSVLYQKKPSDDKTGIGLPKKVVIIASQNKRLEQI